MVIQVKPTPCPEEAPKGIEGEANEYPRSADRHNASPILEEIVIWGKHFHSLQIYAMESMQTSLLP